MAFVPSILALFLTGLFDSVSTLVGVAESAGLKDSEGKPLGLRKGLIADAWVTLLSGVFGSSPGTVFIESASGVAVGAKTGLASVVTACCFLPFLFLAPLVSVVPGYATGPVLIIVGTLMFRCVSKLKLDKLEETLPAFLTVCLIPLTFSITQGLLWGFISHTVLFLTAG